MISYRSKRAWKLGNNDNFFLFWILDKFYSCLLFDKSSWMYDNMNNPQSWLLICLGNYIRLCNTNNW